MIRLYIAEPTPVFAAGLVITLNPDQGRYLTSVMRKGVGDDLLVFNGRDGEWRAAIVEAGKKAVRLELQAMSRAQPESQGPVLAIALIKRGPLESIVEKATELGVAQIQLIVSRRCNAAHTRLERLQAIAQEAAEQTERLDVPEVVQVVKLDDWLRKNTCANLIFADEDSAHDGESRATPPMLAGLDNLKPGQSIILIGPEGGFDDDERRTLRGLPNVHPVNLGPRILRADTAAISALALFQAAAGDWR